jgi:hypothetical protein
VNVSNKMRMEKKGVKKAGFLISSAMLGGGLAFDET